MEQIKEFRNERKKNSEMDSNINGQLIFSEGAKEIQYGKIHSCQQILSKRLDMRNKIVNTFPSSFHV